MDEGDAPTDDEAPRTGPVRRSSVARRWEETEALPVVEAKVLGESPFGGAGLAEDLGASTPQPSPD